MSTRVALDLLRRPHISPLADYQYYYRRAVYALLEYAVMVIVILGILTSL